MRPVLVVRVNRGCGYPCDTRGMKNTRHLMCVTFADPRIIREMRRCSSLISEHQGAERFYIAQTIDA